MSCTLTTTDDPAIVVELTHGPEWGYQPSVSMAIEWRKMTSSLWRKWDAGPLRDFYVSNWTYRGTTAQIDALARLVSSLRGKSILLSSDEGIWPFGPLIDCETPVPVRIGPYSPSGVQIGANIWTFQLPIYLDVTQPLPAAGSLTEFLSICTFTPSLVPGWAMVPRESLVASESIYPDAPETVATAILRDGKIVSPARHIMHLRGEAFTITGALLPFGPGVDYSNGAGSAYNVRCKAFSWSHLAASAWRLSLTLVRDP